MTWGHNFECECQACWTIEHLTAERDAHKKWHEKCDRALKETLAERDRYREALEDIATGHILTYIHDRDLAAKQMQQHARRALDGES